MGNFNKKSALKVQSLPSILSSYIRHGATAGYRQLLVLKVVLSLYYISTNSVVTGRSGSSSAMCGRALSEINAL